ncbi:MAG: MATE family efflux transporter [Anaerovoracaceae bacterium]
MQQNDLFARLQCRLAKTLIPGLGLLRPEHYQTDEGLGLRMKKMLPGMLIEQCAAVVIENMNIFVMGFVSMVAMAGVSQVNTINNTLMNLFQAFAIGGTVMTAQHIGGNDRKKASEAAMMSVLLGLAVSVFIAAAFFLVREEIIYLLYGEAEEEVLASSLEFFTYSILTPPLWFLYFQCNGIMRSCGDTTTPMYISVVMNGSSVGLNLLFVLVFHMGAVGTGLAQLVSIGVSALAALIIVLRPGFTLSMIKDGFGREGLPLIKKVAAIAFPSSAENLMFNGSRVVLQVFLAGMGATMISANQVFNSVNQITLVPFMAMYYLVIPIIGQEAGTGDEERAQSGLGRMYRISLKIAAWTAAAQVVLSYPLCWLFTREPQVISIGFRMMLIYAVVMIFQAPCFILPNGFKGAGDVKYAMVFSSITAWVIRVGGTWLLGVQLGWEAYALAVTQGLDYIVRGIAYYGRFKSRLWLRALKEKS